MVNAQEWLDREYPKDQRKEINELDIREKGLEGSLDLSDFVNLEYSDFTRNFITVLNANGLSKLKIIICLNNKIV